MKAITRIMLLALGVMCALTFNVGAEDPPLVLITTYGTGTSSCGLWIQSHHDDESAVSITQHNVNRAWISGFVSGAGYAALKLRKTDSAGMVTFMDQYCTAHPLDPMYEGARALVLELGKP